MRGAAIRSLCLSILLCAGAVILSGAGQQVPAVPATNDPRVGLKAGLHDAGEAAKNLERIASLPKPDGFFDPKAPAGRAAPPEAPPTGDGPAGQRGAGSTPPPFDPVASNRPGYTNSDLAFSGNHVVVGNYHGFNTYDVERPNRPKLLASVVCPGGQGDVSVHGHLLFMSVEQTRGRIERRSPPAVPPCAPERRSRKEVVMVTGGRSSYMGSAAAGALVAAALVLGGLLLLRLART